jgi:hypothetical protein
VQFVLLDFEDQVISQLERRFRILTTTNANLSLVHHVQIRDRLSRISLTIDAGHPFSFVPGESSPTLPFPFFRPGPRLFLTDGAEE